MTTPLPAAPSLEQLRKQAKELVRERKAGSEPLRLSDAQREVAREYGFASWPRLKAYVERVTAHGPGLTHAFVDEIGYYEDRAEGLRSVVASGLAERHRRRARPPSRARRCERGRHPRDQRRGRAPRARARARIRELGAVPSPRRRVWPRAASRSGGRSRRSRRATRRRSAPCSTAIRGSSRRAARTATTCSASPPAAAATTRLVRELLARGADPSSANDRGWTPLHQAGYGNDAELARLLLEAGARTDLYGHGEGGTPLAAALFWGNTKVADLLAEREIAPHNLRIAAGLGRLDLIRGARRRRRNA